MIDEVDLEAANKKPEDKIGWNEVLKGLYTIIILSIILSITTLGIGATIVLTERAKHIGSKESK